MENKEILEWMMEFYKMAFLDGTKNNYHSTYKMARLYLDKNPLPVEDAGHEKPPGDNREEHGKNDTAVLIN